MRDWRHRIHARPETAFEEVATSDTVLPQFAPFVVAPVLLRPPARYAQAGFPTKVVESLALGTPVICNLTSDLGNYIHDGAEGIVCADYQPEDLVAALERALALSVEQRAAMRAAARARAEAAFDYRQYAAPLADFLARIGVPAPTTQE